MLARTVMLNIISNGGSHSSGSSGSGSGSTWMTVMMRNTIKAVPMTSAISEKMHRVV